MMHILYIEDDIESIKIVKKAMKSKGYPFMWALNGEEALALVKAHPGLIIINLCLAGVDAAFLVRQLREFGGFIDQVPIIGLTSPRLPRQGAKALGVGCNAYLQKPLDIKELLSLIGDYLPSPDQRAP